ncbi:ribonuclease inhibitor [Galbibacter pacificus]|nr:ribonuclease inhibitor [Galbibacter pacificus]MDG3583589.1 ribonuclease inhibitor [Galbibacter pacificus]
MESVKKFTIDGNSIFDIPSFYKEVNREFMKNEDWNIAENLDALNDLFYGGFGELKSIEACDLVWKNIAKNKTDLGRQTTIEFYKNKLKKPSIYNTVFIKKKLAELEQGQGKTYFDIIMEIIENHPQINLIEA